MTPRPTRTLILTALALLALAGPTSAQTVSDRGKKPLPKLFSEAVSAVSESTVRVQVDEKDAALGTVVTPDGYVLTRAARSSLRRPSGRAGRSRAA